MKRFFTLAVLGLSLAAFGCASTPTKGDEAVSKDATVKCPKCGATFKVGEGLWERR